MAEEEMANRMEYSTVEELEECQVCFIAYDEGEYLPQMLQCSHTICFTCLESITVASKTNDSGFVKPTAPCPFCRRKTDKDLVQENRYILAHMKKVESTKYKTNQNPTPIEATAPSIINIQDEFERIKKATLEIRKSGGPEWCMHCEDSASKGKCGDCHVVIPLSQFLESKKDSNESNLKELETRTIAISSSVEEMEKVFGHIFAAMKETVKTFDKFKATFRDLENMVKALKESSDEVVVPSEESLLEPCAELLQGIDSASQSVLDYVIKAESAIDIESLTNGNFEIMSDKRRYQILYKPSLNAFDFAIRKS